MSPKKRNWIVPVVLIALFFYMAVRIFSMNTAQPKVEYRTIIDYFKNEQVAEYELDFGTGELTMQLNDEKKTTITYSVPNLSLFLQDTHALVDEYNAEHPDAPIKQYYDAAEAMPWWIDMLPLLLTVLLMGGFWYILMKRSGGGGNPMAFAKLKPKQQDPHNRVTFDDVAGADEEKEELEEIVQFLKDPGKFNALGARIPKGVLLMGPPGTGKTLLAKAVAGEAGVPFFSISGSDFVEMFVGVGASRVRDLFEQAKKSAPSIVFIDEIDAVGRHRGSGLGGGHDEREQTLNQLLVEMDGFAPNLGVIVMAATNRKDILDPALLRPGRFDRHITVNYPDVKGREAILRVHTRNKPIGPDVDLAVIARFTGGFTGADLENLTNEAALLAARKNRKAITMEDIQEATLKVAVGPEKRSHVITDKERRLTAYHESGHAIVTYYCPQQDKVHQVSIVPRGWAGGFTLALPEKDVSYQTKKWMEEEIAVLLAGRVAEQLVLEDVSTGASNDIARATKIARAMVCRYGFSEKLGPMIYGSDQEEVFLGRDLGHARDYSEEVAGQIDEEARRFIDEGYNKAVSLLEEHMDQLHALAEFLMKYEKIDGDLFAEVMSGVISFGEAAERTEQELTSAREKAERARLQKEAQQKAAEEKKAQQGFSVDPLDFHLPHEEPPAPPMEEPKEDEDKQDPSGPADLYFHRFFHPRQNPRFCRGISFPGFCSIPDARRAGGHRAPEEGAPPPPGPPHSGRAALRAAIPPRQLAAFSPRGTAQAKSPPSPPVRGPAAAPLLTQHKKKKCSHRLTGAQNVGTMYLVNYEIWGNCHGSKSKKGIRQ